MHFVSSKHWSPCTYLRTSVKVPWESFNVTILSVKVSVFVNCRIIDCFIFLLGERFVLLIVRWWFLKGSQERQTEQVIPL